MITQTDESRTTLSSVEKNSKNTSDETSESDKLFANYSEKERKSLFLYVIVAIILMELAASIGAVIYSIVGSGRSDSGFMRFQFPWLGFSVAAFLIPVTVLLILHLVSMVMNRDDTRNPDKDVVTGKAAVFFGIVRGAPTIILLTGLIVLGAAIYYVDGVMALMLKLADSFGDVAFWLIGALTVAFCVKGITGAVYRYHMHKSEAEYAFRREVLEKTGMIVLDTRHAAHTKLCDITEYTNNALPYRVAEPLPSTTMEENTSAANGNAEHDCRRNGKSNTEPITTSFPAVHPDAPI